MRRTFLLLFCVLASCKNDVKTTPADSSAATAEASAATSDASAPVTEADAKALLDKWLAAQNAGTFPAYEALYAPRFEGVRRSGTQTARLDRARWMKERAKMFEKKTTVEAKDVVVTAAREGADVRFVQSWAQEGYKDEGPKRMVLSRVKGELKIAREELLRSNVVSPNAITSEKFAFAIHASGPMLVLSETAKDGWMTGAPKLLAKSDPWPTRTAVDMKKLPPELAAWNGKSVELFKAGGAACEGTVSSLAVVTRVIPHFGMVSSWLGTGDFQGEKPLSPAEIAKEAGGLGGAEGTVLVAEIRSEADCKGALWGRVKADKAPVLAEGKADAKVQARALAELRKTKAWSDMQARYDSEKEPGDPKDWFVKDGTTTARSFEHSGTTIITLSINAGRGCGSFGGTLSAAWEDKNGTLVLVRDPSEQELLPTSAGDFDGDGSIDLLLPEMLWRKKGGKYEPTNKLTIPFLDCGC